MLTLEKMRDLGIDPTDGLTRCMNNEVFFFKMISMAVANDYFDTLGPALEKNDLESAFEAAHAIKGLASNLGFGKLYEASYELTEKLRAKDYEDIEGFLSRTEEAQKEVLEAISGLE